jgi:hypothetical protein
MEREMAITLYDLAVENHGVAVHRRGVGPRRLRRYRRISMGPRDFELPAADDTIAAWRGRMLDAFGDLAGKTRAHGR